MPTEELTAEMTENNLPSEYEETQEKIALASTIRPHRRFGFRVTGKFTMSPSALTLSLNTKCSALTESSSMLTELWKKRLLKSCI